MEKLVPWLLRSPAVLRPTATRFHNTRSFYSTAQLEDVHRNFWKHKVDPNQIFYSIDLSFAMMNILPLCPDVLVCPRRKVMRFSDLTSEEVSDLWISAQKIGVQVQNYHKASSTAYAIQDGPLAGQRVPHVHIHNIPRIAGDWKHNDTIYDSIYENEKDLKMTIDYDLQLAGWPAQYRKLLSTDLDPLDLLT